MSAIKSLDTVNQRGDREISIDEIKLDNIISHLSGLIEQDNLLSNELNDRTEVEKALSLAMLAMTEAEKRIERQQKRIKQLEKLSIKTTYVLKSTVTPNNLELLSKKINFQIKVLRI